MAEKKKKQSHQGTFNIDLMGYAIKKASDVKTQVQQIQEETEAMPPAVKEQQVQADNAEGNATENTDTTITELAEAEKKPVKESAPQEKITTSEVNQEDAVEAREEKGKPINEVPKEKKQTTATSPKKNQTPKPATQNPPPRRNSEPIKSTKNTEGKTKRNNKTINFALGDDLEARFIPCHRLARMSRNDYYIAMLEKEKAAYEKNKDAYVEAATKKILEEKTVPKSTEKKLCIKVSEELFDFVTEVSYDIYCNKDKFMRMMFCKECERVEKATKKDNNS